jgi:hypothetical protein
MLQFGDVALENLAPARFVGESDLDPPQSLEDRLVLLLESLEALVDRVEVAEHLVAQLGDHLGEPTIHGVEPAIDVGELAPQELDELPVLCRGHGSSVSQVEDRFKRIQ